MFGLQQQQKGMSVSENDHDEILEEINCRSVIDYDELSSDKEVKEDESSDKEDF